MSAETRIQRATNELTLFSTFELTLDKSTVDSILESTLEENTVVTTNPTNIPSSPFTTCNINTNTTTTASCSNQATPSTSTTANRSGKVNTTSEAMAGSRGIKRKLSKSSQDSISSDSDTTDKCDVVQTNPKQTKE